MWCSVLWRRRCKIHWDNRYCMFEDVPGFVRDLPYFYSASERICEWEWELSISPRPLNRRTSSLWYFISSSEGGGGRGRGASTYLSNWWQVGGGGGFSFPLVLCITSQTILRPAVLKKFDVARKIHINVSTRKWKHFCMKLEFLFCLRMRSSRTVTASDSQCRSSNCPVFDPSILRQSWIWVLNKVLKKSKNSPL